VRRVEPAVSARARATGRHGLHSGRVGGGRQRAGAAPMSSRRFHVGGHRRPAV